MRPRYGTTGIVLARTPLAEASASLVLITEEFGLLRARAQGIRKPGAKLASSVQTFTECDVVLIRGKDGWRLSGATMVCNRFKDLSPSMRRRAGRIARLMLRLVQGETNDPSLFYIFSAFVTALPLLDEQSADAAETLVALRLLGVLGLDAGEVPGTPTDYDPQTLEQTLSDRRTYILRVNRGISASGL